MNAKGEIGAGQPVPVHDHRQRRLRDVEQRGQVLLRALRAFEVGVQGRKRLFLAHGQKILLTVNHCQQKNITIRKPLTRGLLPQPCITVSDTIRRVALADELRIYVRELIADKGLNQKELAKAIGASQGYVSMILAGQRLGNEVTFLAKLAGAVDHTLSGLIAEAERRDLTRHGRMGQRDSHLNPGGSDVPASDRLREQLNDVERQLRDERRASAEKIQELRAVAGKLLSLLADEKDAATSARPTKSRRRHRRAG